ncbi:MAG: hypothetical protein AB7P08_04635 [Burkholderiales bacterium]
MTEGKDTMHPAVREARLVERLDTLKAALAGVEAPASLEAALVKSFRASRRPARPSLWWMPPLAMAATIAVVGWMVRAPAAPEFAAPPAGEALAVANPGPFLALKSLERIALEPSATVVSTEFPRALLAQWGLPVSPERAGEPVRAELLYSAEGEALAVRLLN